MTLTAADTQPGDVLLDSDGNCWCRGTDTTPWFTFSGPVPFYGPWDDKYGPQGMLVLLARDGKPA